MITSPRQSRGGFFCVSAAGRIAAWYLRLALGLDHVRNIGDFWSNEEIEKRGKRRNWCMVEETNDESVLKLLEQLLQLGLGAVRKIETGRWALVEDLKWGQQDPHFIFIDIALANPTSKSRNNFITRDVTRPTTRKSFVS